MSVSTIIAWAVGFIMFFPILWTALAAFKTETDAYSLSAEFLVVHWTIENFGIVQERSNYLRYVLNTTIIAVGVDLLGLLVRHSRGLVDGVPAEDAPERKLTRTLYRRSSSALRRRRRDRLFGRLAHGATTAAGSAV